MSKLLDVSGLRVAYGSSVAIHDVDIVVPEGCVVGVLGPNGAGKSTLMGAIAGVVRPVDGEIRFDGERIERQRASTIANHGVCLIPEGRGLFPGLTVADNLKLMLGSDGAAVARVHERFPILRERQDQPAGTLSGGEQQMLSFARAARSDVRLLLADEPSLGLAPRLVDMVEDTLRDLGRDRTVVWVEQYASRVLGLADIVYVLGRGRVVWAGEPSELRASPVLIKSYLGGSVER